MSSPTASGPAAPELALARVAWEPVVFAEAPRRLDLVRLVAPWPLEPLRVTVLRNRTFEPIAAPLAAFGAYAGLAITTTAGGYDDSLTASEAPEPHDAPASDLEILWLDHARYRLAPPALAEFVAQRAAERAARTRRPVLVADDDRPGADAEALNAALRAQLRGVPGVALLELAGLATRLGPAWRDERLRALTASDLTDRAAIEIARDLAFRAIPSATRPRLKLVAVDLDNTLVDGVVGEDGVAGVRIGPERAAIARTLAALAERGVLVALVSRNEPADVEALFAGRPDLELPRAALFALEAGWRPKAEALADIVARARIGMDAVLFVDDNPGELAAVAAAHPSVRVLSALDGALAARALAAYPGLHGYEATREDALRATDLAAAAARTQARTDAGSEADWLRSLRVELAFAADDPAALARATELSGKTNQFNTALRRFTGAELAERLAAPDARIVTVSLRDRLSDSGIVASVVARAEASVLVVEEVCISCRALGRGLETPIVADAVAAAAGALGTARVRFDYAAGPRNEPARAWLEGVLGEDPAGHPTCDLGTLAAHRPDDTPIAISWRTP